VGPVSPVWRVEVETEGREVYVVEADTEDEARALVDGDADLGRPLVSEVTSFGPIISVELEDEVG
jgi:hypothetical protein